MQKSSNLYLSSTNLFAVTIRYAKYF